MSLLKSFAENSRDRWCIRNLAFTCVIWSVAIPSFAHEQRPRSAKQIVILYTHRTLTPINADWDRGIRSALTTGFDEPLDIEIEYLNLVRHKDPDYLRGWIELLKTKYAAKPPDLVIPVYMPAIEFTLKYRETIFPNVPIVFCSAPAKLAERAHGQPKVTGVAFRLDIAGTVETAQRLHPAHNRLMVLSGSSEPERALKRATQDAIRVMSTGMEIDFVEGLPRSQLLEKVEAADRNTSILMLTYEEDTVGNNYSTVEIVEQMSTESSVPVYGLYDTLLGHGIVGGSLQSAEAQGKLAGGLAVRVLKGERPEDMPIVGLDTVRMVFDARQLRRLNISMRSLPPDSRVLFREPTFWEQFGAYVLLGGAAIVLQSLIITTLLVNRSRRVVAEHEARDLAGKILTAQEDERRYLAREMHDDLSQRLAASAIEAGNLEQRFQESPESCESLGKLKKNLIAICDDVHRLSRQIHPAILDDFGLADALHSECDHFADRERVIVEFRSGELPANLPKAIALCLYRIAQEALWNAAKYAHTKRVVVELNADPEFVHLEIRDFGRGFEPLQVAESHGLGLASMKERARLVRGTIIIDSSPGKGAKITVQVPLPEHEA
ncbi:Oxygen sensor histidine kinase NreB [Anatilimnocola aggregata]|uniref:Oxygen sensor histidine kinase NreB n=1 Tax=Anatilimnocola aggregata TaxID=2528021 RepID=A0A517YFG8_9BACT|nr:Oxygen sensor histidine kinase NreB [Anatilimnocola aggregata]